MSKRIFHYSRDDGRYLDLSIEANEDLNFAHQSPLEPGVYLIPAFATDIEPPAEIDKWPVFQDGAWILVDFITSTKIFDTVNGEVVEPVLGKTLSDLGTDKPKPVQAEHEVVYFENGDWVVRSDWRGHEYWLDDGSHHVITEIGIEPPANALDAMPVIPPTVDQMVDSFKAAIQANLDAFVQQRGYDGILSACTYASSTVTKFRQEGQRCVDLRDQTWAASYVLLDEVMQGSKPMPASIDDVRNVLPALTWED
jgi:hypothetical protein